MLLTSLLLWARLINGQSVALVLSGGGAKGLAHAGVLKVLEENDIPIDYIVGTSMGGVIGGLYAAGYSPDEIQNIACSEDLQKWVRGEADDAYKIYYTTDHVDPSWVSLKLRLDSKFSVFFNPTIAKDHVLNFVLGEKLAHATHISGGNFDSLFVPFRTTGSEIFTQEEKILKSGDLYKSVRASMAVPFFYRPVKIKDQFLFDGGLYNNFPAELARNEFDPDIIIGVNVATKQLTEYPYENDKSLINESILFAILDKTNPTEIDSSDVFIDVQLSPYNAADFKFAKKIVAAGYQSGKDKIPEIKDKISRRKSSEELRVKRNDFNNKIQKEIEFDSILIEGYTNEQTHYLYDQFPKSRPFTFNDLKYGYYKIVSDDYFSSIMPSYELSKSGNTFIIDGSPDPELIGRIGGTLTTRSISQLYMGFDYKTLNRKFSHYSLKLFTGRFYQSALLRAKINFASRLDISVIPEFVFNQWDYINSSDFFIRGINPTILKRYDFRYGFKIEVPVNKNHKILFENTYFEYSSDYSNDLEFISTTVLDNTQLNGYSLGAYVSGNKLNFDQYAYKGSSFDMGVKYFRVKEDYDAGGTSNITSFEDRSDAWFNGFISGSRYYELSKGLSVGISGKVNYSNQPLIGTIRGTQTMLPGYNPFQDSKTLLLENFISRKYAAGGIISAVHLANSLQFRMEGHVFNSFEVLSGNRRNKGQFENRWDDLRVAASGGFVFQSLIGPVSLSVNYYDDVENQWGVLLHFGYILFNKDALE